MRPTTSRPLLTGLALGALAVVLVACGPGVTGAAAPAATGSTSDKGAVMTELSPVPPSISTVPSGDLPTAEPTLESTTAEPTTTATTPTSRPTPAVTSPGPVTTSPDPVVPSVPLPVTPPEPGPGPEPEPEPEPETTVVDAEAYWSDAVAAYAWRSPSSNLLCLLQPAEQIVACAAFDHTIAPAEGCYPDQPVVAELSPGTVLQGCTGDVPYSGEVLPYNSTIIVGTITCSSSSTGMVCDNGDLAFMLSRDSLDFAG